MPSSALLLHLTSRLDSTLSLLRCLVEHESPSRDKAALDALADRLTPLLADAGASSVERIPNDRGGDHLLARFPFGHDPDPQAPDAPRPALLLAHFDTVWPLGTIDRMPFRRDGNRVSGPGTFDMKGGLTLLLVALAALRDLNLAPPRPVAFLLTSDEEIGSPTSRPLIESAARRAAFALVPEPPLPGGALKTARKGVGRYTLSVTGIPAHAGIEPEKGRSAVLELAHQIIAIHAMADPAAGTTLTVGRAEGGGAVNVVPASATAEIDLRVSSRAEADRVDRALHCLLPALDGTRLALSGGLNRPPMERSPAIASLFDRARAAASSALGLDLAEGSTGGGSDANFTAALGLPTLDGLGPLGAGAHAEHEHIEVDTLPLRAALLATLLRSL
ncbi:M20 family metallopeptidase [Tautonia sociabilis]|uniref:M20 family peptidase n=1 Tax=Tautonia sociabilis TaxID=2080755 RepID=A0A432MBW7_9BACT|nr:M20 family metallopeptidase [Tautonia sociabilis]RUL81276.1 M20 family peptidase [Tautonia sociabilis]